MNNNSATPKPFRLKVRFEVEKEIDLTYQGVLDYFLNAEDFDPINNDLLTMIRALYADDAENIFSRGEHYDSSHLFLIDVNPDDMAELQERLRDESSKDPVEDPDGFEHLR